MAKNRLGNLRFGGIPSRRIKKIKSEKIMAFGFKKKKVNEEYQERRNGIYEQMKDSNKFYESLFSNECEQIEKWTGKKMTEKLFDSETDDYSKGKSVFGTKIN